MGLEHFQPGLRVTAAKGLDEALDAARAGLRGQHIEQRRREVRGQVAPHRADMHRGDLHRIGEVEHGRGVIAGRRTGELLQARFFAGHPEAQHRGGRQRLSLRRSARGGNPHDHGQAEAAAHVPA